MKTLSARKAALLAAIILCLFAATALAGGTPAVADGETDGFAVSVTETAGRVIVAWDGVKGDLCSVLINGVEVAAGLSVFSFDVTSFVSEGGRYEIAVVAASGSRGEAVFERTVTLHSPNTVRYSDGVVYWDDDFPDGTTFSVSVNGIFVGRTDVAFMSVIALPSGGDYVATITALPADGSEYVLPSAPAKCVFSVSASPLPPATVKVVSSRDRYYAVWCESDGDPDGYYVELRSESGVHVSETVTDCRLDITDYILQNKAFILSVCAVKDGVRGVARSVAIPAVGEAEA